MVTLKREAKTESDRYGGYITRFNSTMSDYRRSPMASRDTLTYDTQTAPTFEDEKYRSYLWNELQRTEPRKILKPEELDESETYSRERRDAEISDYETRKYSSYNYNEKTQRISPARQRASLNAKAKILIAVYVLVVVLFTALIVVNAAGLENLTGNIAAAQEALNQESALLSAERDGITVLTDEEIMNLAKEYGMVAVENSGSFELIPLNGSVDREVQTGWFDSFCDWISNVTGG